MNKKAKGNNKLSPEELQAKQMPIAELHAAIAAPHPGLDLPMLGHARAVVISCACANTSPLNLARTLDELGIDGNSFQTCVFNGVRDAGYTIQINAIPDSGDTKLIDVVIVIQNAPRTT